MCVCFPLVELKTEVTGTTKTMNKSETYEVHRKHTKVLFAIFRNPNALCMVATVHSSLCVCGSDGVRVCVRSLTCMRSTRTSLQYCRTKFIVSMHLCASHIGMYGKRQTKTVDVQHRRKPFSKSKMKRKEAKRKITPMRANKHRI